ncbi:serine/threonine-protein kinase [Niveomyces insectorum RCEF 264]|uniref:Serine/threonine-protein kinase n=1 Tax=Niveomyces insectorum RCEF 264 TaxID=1081102 RepID=A0A167T873_9HYPO|nr:serine/threonine-protein kinase [Niveomyces insectorum RCEF 264]
MAATVRLSSFAMALMLLQLMSLFTGRVEAAILEIVMPKEECGLVMFDIYGDYSWLGVGYPDYYGMLCTNPNALVSIYAGVYTYCPAEVEADSLHIMQEWCKNYGEVDMLPASDFAANLTKEAIAALPVYSRDQFEEDSNMTAPFLMDQAWFEVAMRSEHLYDKSERSDAFYTMAQYGFWFAILVFGMTQNAIRKVIEKRRGYVYADAAAESRGRKVGKPGIFAKSVAVTRKYFVTPSTLPPYHQIRFMGCTIPTRAESFVITSYWIIVLVLSCIDIHSMKDNIFWDYSASQIWRGIADRTGTMSYGNIPILWMFSGRNNIFIWLTGWSFGTFNMFHRHVARMATLQAIFHSIGWTGYYYAEHFGNYYRSDYQEFWFTIGVVATVVMSFIILFSFSYFRTKFYENFLLVHIVLSVLLIVFLYYHTSIYDLDQYNYPFLFTAAGIWAFDRFARLIRQAYCNIHVSRNRGKGVLTTKATVTYHAAANLLTLDIIPANDKIFPGPGQHYFVYQPLRFLGWENHPFTLARWTQASPKDDLHLQFWVRPNKGWTKKLMNECIKKGSNGDGESATIPTTLLLEGPYGASEPLHCFDQVLLVAGGSGIAGVLPYLLDYVRRADEGAVAAAASGGNSGRIPTRTRHVTLVWADRREAYIRFVADGCLASVLDRPDVQVSFHLTTAAVNSTSTASSLTDAVHSPSEEKTGVLASSDDLSGSGGSATKRHLARGQYHILSGRPDVLSTVRKLATSVHDTDERLAVMVCGPGEMSDNVRHVVAESMEKGRDSIEYFEESFGW